MSKVGKCNLCLQDNKELKNSHIVPKFVFRWLKNTSATDFIISTKDTETRFQDGEKDYFFCGECENLFGKLESEFSKKIFYPYVNEELDSNCIARGKIKEIKYDEWLLRFIISLQFRHLVNSEKGDELKKLNNKLKNILSNKINDWRKYLLGEISTTNNDESHIFFYQNIAFADGYFPKNMNNKTASYLLRAIDSSVVTTKNDKMGIYIKIGPISFYTSIIPNKLNKTRDSKIKKHGTIYTAQVLENIMLNDFLFIVRPNEFRSVIKISKKREDQIIKSLLNNEERYISSKTFVANNADIDLNKKIINWGERI